MSASSLKPLCGNERGMNMQKGNKEKKRSMLVSEIKENNSHFSADCHSTQNITVVW